MPLPDQAPIPTPTPSTALLPNAESLTLAPHDQRDTVAIVGAWHDDTHPGVWAFCDLQPCDAVRRSNGSGRDKISGGGW